MELSLPSVKYLWPASRMRLLVTNQTLSFQQEAANCSFTPLGLRLLLDRRQCLFTSEVCFPEPVLLLTEHSHSCRHIVWPLTSFGPSHCRTIGHLLSKEDALKPWDGIFSPKKLNLAVELGFQCLHPNLGEQRPLDACY